MIGKVELTHQRPEFDRQLRELRARHGGFLGTLRRLVRDRLDLQYVAIEFRRDNTLIQKLAVDTARDAARNRTALVYL